MSSVAWGENAGVWAAPRTSQKLTVASPPAQVRYSVTTVSFPAARAAAMDGE